MFIRQALIVGRPFAYIAYENTQTDGKSSFTVSRPYVNAIEA